MSDVETYHRSLKKKCATLEAALAQVPRGLDAKTATLNQDTLDRLSTVLGNDEDLVGQIRTMKDQLRHALADNEYLQRQLAEARREQDIANERWAAQNALLEPVCKERDEAQRERDEAKDAQAKLMNAGPLEREAVARGVNSIIRDNQDLRAQVEAMRRMVKAAKAVINDWLAVCEKYPVNQNIPSSLHPCGQAIAWQSLYNLQKALADLAPGKRQ